MDLGDKIREARQIRGMSLTELARQSGVSRSYLYDLEKGISVPTIPIVVRVENALGIRLTTREEDLSINERQLLEAWRNGRMDVILKMVANKVGAGELRD